MYCFMIDHGFVFELGQLLNHLFNVLGMVPVSHQYGITRVHNYQVVYTDCGDYSCSDSSIAAWASP